MRKMAKICTFYDHVTDISKQENIPIGEAMGEARKLGVELLEVSQNNLLGREDEVERELSQAGLGISSIPAYFHFGVDTDVEKQGAPTLAAARRFGVKRILVIPGFFQKEDTSEQREIQIQNMIGCIDRLAELADKDGISLIMEDYDNVLAPFSTIEGVNRFVTQCEKLSCCFDTGNFRFSAQDELLAYETLKETITHVHLKDRAYSPAGPGHAITAMDGQELYPCPVGGGDLNLLEIMNRLKRDGYQGDFSVEHYGAGDMLNFLKKSVSWVKEHL